MQVRLKHGVDCFGRDISQGDARVVEEQVEAALLPFDLIDRRSQRRFIGQIEMYGPDIARASVALLNDFRNGTLGRITLETVDEAGGA